MKVKPTNPPGRYNIYVGRDAVIHFEWARAQVRAGRFSSLSALLVAAVAALRKGSRR